MSLEIERFTKFEMAKERWKNLGKELVEQTVPIEVKPEEPIRQKIEERWTVYLFTVPVRYSKKIAWGFESKQEAEKFIRERLEKKQKSVEDELGTYHIRYDVILESREEIDVYANDPKMTSVGNNYDKIWERWVD